MKLTLNWLQNYVDLEGLTSETLADQLTMLGLEVDSVYPVHEFLAQLKTGVIASYEKHPDADKLSVCQVQIGEDTHQIVCGAPNVREGLHVVVALPGTVLPGNFKIKKSKIRGVASGGMMCSERELELSDSHEGIMELPETTDHGLNFLEAMSLADTGVEVDLTPNRPDCASVIGVAREVAAINKRSLTLPVKDQAIVTKSNEFQVEIKNPELCSRYAGKLVKGVTIGPSPLWLRNRLLNVGLRPINNVVDITNYVMLEYGQPLHAFDFDTLNQGRIVVRTPQESEKTFPTLDGSSRDLTDDMLLICDGKQPVAVAGVMGGLDSEVTEKTTNVLLESACFNPVSIRKTARRLNLSTDASYRFERGVDPLGTIDALNRAANLLCELADGTCTDDGIDCFPVPTDAVKIDLNTARTNSLLGLALSTEEIAELLESIELRCEKSGETTLQVTVPSFRVDIEREADLVEEVARLYGYDNVPTTLPGVTMSFPEQDPNRLKRLHISKALSNSGYAEAINYSFTAASHNGSLNIPETDARFETLPLLNPLSEEQSVMRSTLLPGLLENVRRNINFQQTGLRLFELGKVFFPKESDQQPSEHIRLAGTLSGNRNAENSPLYFKPENADIFDAKGVVECIVGEMGLTLGDSLQFSISEANETEPYCERGYELRLKSGETDLGSIGKFTADVLTKFSIKNEVYFFDLDFDALCEIVPETVTFGQLPVFPSVKRDIALVVNESVSSGELLSSVQSSRDKLIESVEIFDVFQGGKLEKGQKSVAISITYRSKTKTLTDKNVEKSHSKIVRLLTDTFGGSLRDA